MNFMFLSRKNQYFENDFITKCYLQIQCYPYQITNAFFTELEHIFFKIHMKKQKTPNSQRILEKEEWAGGINLPDFSLYFNATVIKIVQFDIKEKYRPMEQDIKPRDKPMHLWVPYF